MQGPAFANRSPESDPTESVQRTDVRPPVAIESFLTYAQVAERLGVPIFKVRRAARSGVFPTYTLYNGRRLVRLSEVIAVIEASRDGGRGD